MGTSGDEKDEGDTGQLPGSNDEPWTTENHPEKPSAFRSFVVRLTLAESPTESTMLTVLAYKECLPLAKQTTTLSNPSR